jgi:hypothetical protein
MQMVNKLVSWFSGGALLGLFLASAFAPGALGWYNSPADGMAMCDCLKCTTDTASRLLGAQTVGAGVVGALSLGLGIVVEVRRRKKAAAAA